jgi:hypothetical protein
MLNRSVPSFFHGKATSERPFCASNAVAHFPFAFSPSSPGSQPTAMSCFLLVLDERRLQILGLCAALAIFGSVLRILFSAK